MTRVESTFGGSAGIVGVTSMFAMLRSLTFRAVIVLAIVAAIYALLQLPALMRPIGRGTGVPGSYPEGWSHEETADAMVVCSGHFAFDWNPFHFPKKVELKFHQGLVWGATRTIRPFRVDHYWKGSGPGTVEVAVFETGTNHENFELPPRGRLFVALKNDTTGSGAYQLVEQMDTWLAIEDRADERMAGMTPDQAVREIACDDLESYIAAPTDDTKASGGREVSQALITQTAMKANDETTLSLLERMVRKPEPGGGTWLRGRALYQLAQLDAARAWKIGYGIFDKETLTPEARRQFAGELASAITPESLSYIEPVQIQHLMDSDPEAENYVSLAFMNMKDARAIPWLGRLLSSRQRLVQYHAMIGLRQNFIGRDNIAFRPGTTFTDHDAPYPEEIVAPYKKWVQEWLQQHTEVSR